MAEVTVEMIADVDAEFAAEEAKAKAGRPARKLDMDLIIASHEAGYSAKEIAELLAGEGVKVCAATVRSRLKKAGFKLSRGARKCDISSEEITALYVDAGKNLADTAHELGISVVTLRNRMTEFEIPVRKRGRQAIAVEVEVELEGATESA
jgi:lambda repressor-like predicted transcriptional regulator